MKKERIPEPRSGLVGAIYCRKSDVSESQNKQGRSTSQQLAKCLLAAKSLGVTVPERFQFVDEDGVKGEWFWRDQDGRHPGPHRPALTRMMEEIESKDNEIDVVICWRTDRVYRDEIVAGYFLRVLRNRGVRFSALNHDLAIHTASGYQAATTEACANKAYRDKIAEDVQRNHQMLAEVGMLPCDPGCLGFRSKGKGSGEAVPILEEIELVRRIFKWFVLGDPGEAPLSLRGISIRCEQRGYRVGVGVKNQKTKDPRVVWAASVRTILKNARYISKLRWGGKLYDTEAFLVPAVDGSERMETVVSEDIFWAAQEKVSQGRRFESDPRAKLLSGALLCPCCGHKVYFQGRGNGDKAILCPYRNGRLERCVGENARSLAARLVEGWVREHLAPLLVAEVVALRALQDGNSDQRELASLERRIGEMLRIEGEQLSALVGTMDASQFSAVAAKLRADREVVERRAYELKAKLRHRTAQNASDPYDLVSQSEEVLHQALLRAVRWISVTRQGIVCLTSAGAYIGAYFAPGKRFYARGNVAPTILPPSVEATRECRSWILNEERFLVGARTAVGRWGKAPSDQELLPDYREVSDDGDSRRIA